MFVIPMTVTEAVNRKFLGHVYDRAAWNSQAVMMLSPALGSCVKHDLPAEP